MSTTGHLKWRGMSTGGYGNLKCRGMSTYNSKSSSRPLPEVVNTLQQQLLAAADVLEDEDSHLASLIIE